MTDIPCNPRVLIVTPEVTYLPDRMGGLATFFTAKAGGLADVSAALISALFEQGADVHVALPDYRTLFSDRFAPVLKKEIKSFRAPGFSHSPPNLEAIFNFGIKYDFR